MSITQTRPCVSYKWMLHLQQKVQLLPTLYWESSLPLLFHPALHPNSIKYKRQQSRSTGYYSNWQAQIRWMQGLP